MEAYSEDGNVMKKIKQQSFVPLHFHTEFSFLDSIISVNGLGRELRRRGFSACAITDHGNLNGSFGFVSDLKSANVKSIIGIEFYAVSDRFRRGLTDGEKKEAIDNGNPKPLVFHP